MNLFILFGCVSEKPVTEEQDQFVMDYSVRIDYPENGALVEDSFYLQYTLGDSVQNLELWINNEEHSPLDITQTETLVYLDSGSNKLELVALDDNSEWLSQHSITVIVPTDYWVTIASPTDGSIVTNPIDTSEQLEDILTKPLSPKAFNYLRKKFMGW